VSSSPSRRSAARPRLLSLRARPDQAKTGAARTRRYG
jgi:hypothetical protein